MSGSSAGAPASGEGIEDGSLLPSAGQEGACSLAPSGPSARRAIALLTLATLLVIVGAINRLTRISETTFFDLSPFLWKDFWSIFVLAPVMAGVLALQLREFSGTGPCSIFLFVFFAAVMGASMGLHDLTNAMSRPGVARTAFHETIKFLDDGFSHGTFFVSFAGVSLLVIAAQVRTPIKAPMSVAAIVAVMANSLVLAAMIFANMAPEEKTGIDLIVILLVLSAAVGMRLRSRKPLRRLPVSCYFESAFALGLVSSVVAKTLR